jgi:predicted ATPase
MCFALTWCGCAVSLRIGDLEKAERSINLLRDCSEKHSLINYQASALGYQGLLMARRGEILAGEASLRAALDGLCEAQFEVQYTPFLVGLAEVVAMSGRPDEALALADEAMQRTERNDVFWCMPETLRIRGEILLSNKDVVAAEELFRRSLDLAQRQNALFWELRTAMSLGKLRMTLGGIRDAHDILNSVYKRFTEGFETADLQRAELLLKEWVLS